MASDVTLSTAMNQQAKTSTQRTQLAEDFDDFLVLLTTQLQNQDPLSPMDTTEFTNQLVAFAGVEQSINTNQKLDSLVSMQIANGFTNALSYVGMDVNYVSSEMNFDGETPVDISYAIEGEAAFTNINITDEQGNLVATIPGETAGTNKFTWDGTTNGGSIAEPGTYNVRIDSTNIDGAPVQSTTVVKGRVSGIETQNGAIFLLVGERAVSPSQVINAEQPPAPAIPETPEEESGGA